MLQVEGGCALVRCPPFLGGFGAGSGHVDEQRALLGESPEAGVPVFACVAASYAEMKGPAVAPLELWRGIHFSSQAELGGKWWR